MHVASTHLRTRKGEPMHYILFYDVVDDYVSRRAQFREAHLKLARQAYERGELVLAGALADPVDGAVLVFRGLTPQAAEAFAQADPYVTNRLVTRWPVGKGTTGVGHGGTPPCARACGRPTRPPHR